jgi:drug/metabolite transporter, DME family
MQSRPTVTSGYLLVLLAAALWATIGVIYRYLSGTLGLPPLVLAAARAGLGGLVLLAGLALFRRPWLRLDRGALALTLAYGVLGIAVFYATYVYAVVTAGVAVASVLLYTAPAWVALVAWRFLGEKPGRVHILALACTLAGAALVAGLGSRAGSAARLSLPGILWGLASGLTYAVWSVFNSVGVRRVSPWTFQCYGMLVGGAVLLAVLLAMQPPAPLAAAATASSGSPAALGWLVLLAAGPTVGASIAYSSGVRRVPVSIASVVATLEPVLAAVLAAVVLGERLSPLQVAGGGLILLAVWLLRPRRR